MRIVFMGTPDFSVLCLKNLMESNHEVVAVVTQPDRKRDRNVVSFCPVKECAVKYGVPVYQYEKVSRDGINAIRALKPDVIVTAAFGQMLSQEFLDIAPYGVINVHASLLPKYRGSSPIQWTVVNGEKESGITIMRTAYKMDSGDIILQVKTDVGEDETAGELFDRLSKLGAPALISALDIIEKGTAVFTPQNESEATYFPMLKKCDGKLDFSMTAKQIKCRVQGFNPWPSAYTCLNCRMLKIHRVSLYDGSGAAGTVIKADKNGLVVACGEGAVALDIIQPENGKKMSYKDYLLGHRVVVGTKL